MSDELETMAKGGGIVAAIGFVLNTLWRAFIRRGEKAEDRAEQDLREAITELRGENKQLRERLEGVAKSHREQLETEKEARHQLALKVQDHETRLLMREGLGGEPRTNPGSKPSDAVLALRAEHRARIAREESGNGD